MWTLAALVALGVLSLIAGRVDRLIARWPQSGQAGVSPTHCADFVTLAKTAYGEDWKSRLDPSDTTCATEVQEAWEQQRISRDAQAQSLLEPTQPATTQPAEPQAEATSTAARAPAAQTYCLNVVSLAKAKYGADWQSKIDAAARAACAGSEATP